LIFEHIVILLSVNQTALGSTVTKAKLLTESAFKAVLPKLQKALLDALTKEQQDCALPESDTDLWDFPPVDSKTVVKLAPVVKELIGHRLRPTWIRKGGYPSKEEAVEDLVAKIHTHCVIGAAAQQLSKPAAVALTS